MSHRDSANGLLNLTPHDIRVQIQRLKKHQDKTDAGDKDPGWVTIPKSGTVVRVRSKPQQFAGKMRLEWSDAAATQYVLVCTPPSFEAEDPLIGFPFTQDDDSTRGIVVSMLVAPHVPSWYRGNVYVPDTGPESAVRDSTGKMIGVKRLCLWLERNRATQPSGSLNPTPKD